MEKVRWWNARDKICGFIVKQNVIEGLKEARECVDDEEACWLVSFFLLVRPLLWTRMPC